MADKQENSGYTPMAAHMLHLCNHAAHKTVTGIRAGYLPIEASSATRRPMLQRSKQGCGCSTPITPLSVANPPQTQINPAHLKCATLII